jgi:ABC-2 type transport system ATP-binding protein
MNDLAIETRGLGKRFGERVALESIDLAVPRGTAFGFLGPNGAGKTTLIRLLLGLAKPSSGSFAVLGHEGAARLGRVGAIIEEPRFHAYLTGRENLEIHAAARDRDARKRIPAALDRVGLARRADDRVGGYSLGMRQRLGVARCLLCDPELLVLDEPVNGLDPAGILEFRGLVRSLVDEGRTVWLSSHLLDEVQKTCDVAAIVDGGRVVAQGTIAELTGDASHAVEIVAEQPARAAGLLAAVPAVRRATELRGAIRVELSPEARPDPAVVTALLRALLDGGVEVARVAPVASSLEDRFLDMTTALKERA